jgi:breast cancer 2 susceptibility protein
MNAITPATAAFYTFVDEGIMKGPPEMLKEFETEGLTYVDLEWVENHWKMILWKLASIVKAKPDLFHEKWNYREVKRQLQYRQVSIYDGAAK